MEGASFREVVNRLTDKGRTDLIKNENSSKLVTRDEGYMDIRGLEVVFYL